MVIATEVGEHLDHPVNHTSSEGSSDLVTVQASLHIDLFFIPSEVLVDVFVELVSDVDVLSLLVSGLLSAQTATWVQLAVHHFTSQEGTVGDETLLAFSDRLRILLAETRDANTGSNGSIGLAF